MAEYMKTDYSLGFDLNSCERNPLQEIGSSQFYARCQVGATTSAVMVDKFAAMNLASQTFVDQLKLQMMPHPEPYKIRWQDQYLVIKHRVEVRFTLCGLADLVVCDVLPTHMRVCSLLLGKPWTDRRK